MASAFVILSSNAVLNVWNGKQGTWVKEGWSGEGKEGTKGLDEIDRVWECARVCVAAKAGGSERLRRQLRPGRDSWSQR